MSMTSFWQRDLKIINIICTINILNINVHCLVIPTNTNNMINTINTNNIWDAITCGSGKKYKNCCGKNA